MLCWSMANAEFELVYCDEMENIAIVNQLKKEKLYICVYSTFANVYLKIKPRKLTHYRHPHKAARKLMPPPPFKFQQPLHENL